MIDYPYIVVVCILFVLSVINECDWKNPKYFIVSAIILLIFMGLRAPVVGADTYNYVRFFTGESFAYTTDSRDFEPLFTIYNHILSFLLFRNSTLYMAVNAFIALFPLLILIKRYSYNKPFSILLFFLYGIYIIYFIALRQILALSVMLLGVSYVQSGKPFKMPALLIAFAAAYFLHTSSIIALPIYLILKYVKINKVFSFVSIVASFFIGFVMQEFGITRFFNLLQFLDIPILSRLSTYFDPEIVDTSSFSIIGLSKKMLIGLLVFYLMPEKKINHWFSKLYLTSIYISNIFFEVQMIERINLYFEVFAIICISWALSPRLYSLPFRKKLLSVLCGSVLLLYLFYSFTKDSVNYELSNPTRMHPYCFFFQDYSSHPSVVYNYN